MGKRQNCLRECHFDRLSHRDAWLRLWRQGGCASQHRPWAELDIVEHAPRRRKDIIANLLLLVGAQKCLGVAFHGRSARTGWLRCSEGDGTKHHAEADAFNCKLSIGYVSHHNQHGSGIPEWHEIGYVSTVDAVGLHLAGLASDHLASI